MMDNLTGCDRAFKYFASTLSLSSNSVIFISIIYRKFTINIFHLQITINNFSQKKRQRRKNYPVVLIYFEFKNKEKKNLSFLNHLFLRLLKYVRASDFVYFSSFQPKSLWYIIWRVIPPSITMFSPVINPASSEHRNKTIDAISSGVPILPTGCCILSSSEAS